MLKELLEEQRGSYLVVRSLIQAELRKRSCLFNITNCLEVFRFLGKEKLAKGH